MKCFILWGHICEHQFIWFLNFCLIMIQYISFLYRRTGKVPFNWFTFEKNCWYIKLTLNETYFRVLGLPPDKTWPKRHMQLHVSVLKYGTVLVYPCCIQCVHFVYRKAHMWTWIILCVFCPRLQAVPHDHWTLWRARRRKVLSC